MISTKRVYEESSARDGMRVLVDRLWPRGLSKEAAKLDLWMKDLAPSTELRKWFAHDVERWPEFQRRYAKELRQNEALVAELEALIDRGRVTLLFGAKDEEHNQAVALAAFLSSRGGG